MPKFPKPQIKSDIKFILTAEQAELVKPTVDRMCNDKYGGMVIGTLRRFRDNTTMETYVEAQFKFVDFYTGNELIKLANSRKEEIENAEKLTH